MTPELRYSDASAGFGSWRNVMVSIFTDQLQRAHLGEIQRVHQELLQRYPEGYTGAVIIEPTARALKAELRQPTVDLMMEMNRTNLAGCYVFNGGGVMMTSVRTVVSAMILASRPSRPSRAFSGLAEAAGWLAKQNAELTQGRETYAAGDLLEALRELQRRQVSRHGRHDAP